VSAPSESELRAAYAGRRVLVTGHTGFKGSWLTLWLSWLGAEVTGYALAPEAPEWLFSAAQVEERCRHRLGDVRDVEALRAVVRETRPEYVFHLAAQPLVRRSYESPLLTIESNILGTANLLEAVRLEQVPCALVVVTSDKCYENREWLYGYRENEPMGGHDVYSMSKGAAELVVSAYRRSFFAAQAGSARGVRLATARAGNVIGGGDWAKDRLVVDAVRALLRREPIPVRNPDAVRPWQHVLEPLGGYLLLGARLAGHGTQEPERFCEAWNFGPLAEAARPVGELVQALVAAWGEGSWEDRRDPAAPHEAQLLRLSIEKAQAQLGWRPRWSFEQTVAGTVEWYRAQQRGLPPAQLRELCLAQLRRYLAD
jgi:CDP-glucose 4,6-dehydratase